MRPADAVDAGFPAQRFEVNREAEPLETPRDDLGPALAGGSLVSQNFAEIRRCEIDIQSHDVHAAPGPGGGQLNAGDEVNAVHIPDIGVGSHGVVIGDRPEFDAGSAHLAEQLPGRQRAV